MDQLDIALSSSIEESPYTVTEVAGRMKMGAQILRNKLCATTNSNTLSLRDAIRLVRITGNVSPFEAIASILGYQLLPMFHDEASCITQAVLHTAAECGDVPRAVHDALGDGVITTREQAEVLKQIRQARDGLNALEASVNKMAKGEVINLEQRS